MSKVAKLMIVVPNVLKFHRHATGFNYKLKYLVTGASAVDEKELLLKSKICSCYRVTFRLHAMSKDMNEIWYLRANHIIAKSI